MALKILLLVLVVLVVVVLLGTRRRPAPPPRGARGESRDAAPMQVLACAHCGVHLPQAEALVDRDGRGYCSEAHRIAGAD